MSSVWVVLKDKVMSTIVKRKAVRKQCEEVDFDERRERQNIKGWACQRTQQFPRYEHW